jgi:hypothetical protein
MQDIRIWNNRILAFSGREVLANSPGIIIKKV